MLYPEIQSKLNEILSNTQSIEYKEESPSNEDTTDNDEDNNEWVTALNIA